mgnify:CR=1 FL=1
MFQETTIGGCIPTPAAKGEALDESLDETFLDYRAAGQSAFPVARRPESAFITDPER